MSDSMILLGGGRGPRGGWTNDEAVLAGDFGRADHYLSLPYAVEVTRLPPEDGGGYMATIPQLGECTFVGDGETEADARASLDALKRHLIPLLLKQGVRLPEPEETR